jgi:cytochrome P450
MKFGDLSSPAFFEDPYPLYERIRGEGAFISLAPNTLLTGRYAVADVLLHDRRMGKACMERAIVRYGETAREQPVFQALSRTFLMMNPPTHTRLRAPHEGVQRAPDRKAPGHLARHRRGVDRCNRDGLGLRPDEGLCVAAAGDDHLSAARRTRRGWTCTGVCREPDSPGLRCRADRCGPPRRDEQSDAHAGTLLRESDRDARTKPGNDLVSALILADEAVKSLTDDEIISNLLLLFTAGHETTSNMLGNALIALHRHPEQLMRLRLDASLTPAAVSECLRYDSSVQMVGRVALEDVQPGDRSLPRGTVVFVMLGAANRDPSQFQRPDELDIGRNAHGRLLSFSSGIHYCLGARLALLELEVGLGTLLSRLPTLRLTGLDALKWQQRNTLRGVESLNATY